MHPTFIPQNIEFLPWNGKKTFHAERQLELQLKEGTKTLTSSFDFILNYIQQKENKHLVSVTVENQKINGKKPDLLISKMTHSIQESLYPYIFSVDDFGKIRNLENFDQIKDRFIHIKKELKHKYSGEAVEMIIEIFEKKLNSSHSFYKELSNEIFYSTLFFPVYRYFGKTAMLENQMLTFPLFLSKQHVEVSGTLKLELQKENNSKLLFSGYAKLRKETEKILKDLFTFSENEEPLKLEANFTTDLSQNPYQSQSTDILIHQSGQPFYKETFSVRYTGVKLIEQKNKKMTFFISEK